jgi:hypothetical protein
MTGTPDQLRTCSAMKLSRQASLVDFAIRGTLRKIDDGLNPRFLRSLGEIHGRVDKAGLDRPDEVGGADAVHRRADSVDLEEIADNDFGAELLQWF